MIGVLGAVGRIPVAADASAVPAQPLGFPGPLIGDAMNSSLALGGRRVRRGDDRLRRKGALHQFGPLLAGLRAGRKLDRRHILAKCDPRGVELRTRLRVRRIQTNADRMAYRRLSTSMPTASSASRPAESSSWRCNGVGTPRLLLNSYRNRLPDGSPTTYRHGGQNLMFTPMARCCGFRSDSSDRAPPRTGALEHGVSRHGCLARLLRGYGYQLTRGHWPVSAAAQRRRRSVPWGAGHLAAFRATADHIAGGFDLRGSPGGAQPRHARSRAEGHPRHSGAEDRLTSRRQQPKDAGAWLARGSEILKAAGATDIWSTEPIRRGGWHLLGTARMGDDPAAFWWSTIGPAPTT